MPITTLFITAIALASDATAVSIAAGLTCPSQQDIRRASIRGGIAFGVFQGGMTFLGWAIGLTFQDFITFFDHWIAFILLALIGTKMIKEAFEKQDVCCISLEDTKNVILLAIATSIDALAVGISFAVLSLTLSDIALATLIIGLITLILSWLGVHIGARLKSRSNLGKHINIIGGIILICIGLKILFEHLA